MLSVNQGLWVISVHVLTHRIGRFFSMYTMVLMMAMSGSGDVTSFGGRLLGGNGSCHGAAVTSGCSGYAAPVASGCSGYASGCSGYATPAVASGCCGGGSGILGLGLFSGRGSSCHGGSGFLGLRSHGSCHGTASHSCMGSSVEATYSVPMVAAPDCGGCGASTVISEMPATATPAVMPAPTAEPKKMEAPKKPDAKPADAPKKTGDGV